MTEQTKPLAEQSPVEIDTQLAALYEAEQKALAAYGAAVVGVMYAADAKRYYGRGQQWSLTKEQAIAKVQKSIADADLPDYKVRDLQRTMGTLDAKALALHDLRREADVLNAEFARRGGWTRAFLAVTSNGHVHNGMNCSTCNNGLEPTRFAWFPQYSGRPESEIVADAGERACTTCYPTAPVSVLSRPTKFFSPDEVAKAKAREEREAKRAKAAAEKVTLPWTESGWRGQHVTADKEFKTLRGATNALAGELASLCWYGEGHPSAGDWKANVEAGREVLGSAWDYDKALASARKKVVREGGQSKF